MKQNNKGFTLVELLVIMAIIAVLASTVLLALNNARQAARDTKRAADVRQLLTALELYYQDNNGYPVQTPSAVGVPGIVAAGYLQTIPVAPLPADSTLCTQTTTGGINNDYIYTSGDGTTYTLTFCLGRGTGSLAAGIHTASPGGIQ